LIVFFYRFLFNIRFYLFAKFWHLEVKAMPGRNPDPRSAPAPRFGIAKLIYLPIMISATNTSAPTKTTVARFTVDA